MKYLKNLKTQCIIVIFCLMQFSSFAQYKIKVLNGETKHAVISANVYFPDFKTSTLTDSNGIFPIDTKNQSVVIQISSVGYETFFETMTLADDLTVYLKPSHLDLQEVVISGNISKLQGENVMNVTTLNIVDNPEIHGLSLSQKLSGTTGISNFNTGAGIGKPVIRGLSGNRIAVFSQGVRLENQQWGDEHGLGLDENGYEQVEIIKGPASLLYGSDAMGGVLFFTGERYARENSIETSVNSGYNTNTNGWRNTGAFKLSKERFHWNVFGGYTEHQDYKDGNNGFVNNSRFHTGDFKTTVGYTGNKFTTSLKYSFLNEQYGLSEAGEEPAAHINSRKPDFPYQNLTTQIISSENIYFLENNSKLKINIGYVFNNRKEFEEQDEPAALNMNLGTFSYNAKWDLPELNEQWTFTAGIQGMYQNNINKGEELLIPDANTSDIGLFVVSDYYYSGKSYWQVGLRADNRYINGNQHGNADDEDYFPKFSKTYSAFNFSTGVYQILTKTLSLRANLSSGYRSPNMFELLSDGVHEGTNRYETGNSNLKAENNYQADVSLNYKTEHLELFANPYFSYIRQYIFLNPSNEIKEDSPVYYYSQTDAYLYGGETGFHFHPHPLDWLHLEGSYSNTYGQNTGKEYLPLMPSQKINATVRANFASENIIKNFSVYLHEKYSFAQNYVSDYETPTGSYNLINAGLAVDFKLGKQKISFNMAVNNIFNKTYYDHLSRYKQENIYEQGRNLSFKLKIVRFQNLKRSNVQD
ncbi:MAG: TonB-dependent receptor [Prevotellaceae bacterium]|jgi:iron complex outermembrane receptor protein|nr:TonB-dependent receptor [Prevotellaceae bacterium]